MKWITDSDDVIKWKCQSAALNKETAAHNQQHHQHIAKRPNQIILESRNKCNIRQTNRKKVCFCFGLWKLWLRKTVQSKRKQKQQQRNSARVFAGCIQVKRRQNTRARQSLTAQIFRTLSKCETAEAKEKNASLSVSYFNNIQFLIQHW